MRYPQYCMRCVGEKKMPIKPKIPMKSSTGTRKLKSPLRTVSFACSSITGAIRKSGI